MAQAPTLDFAAFVAQKKEKHIGGVGAGLEATGHEYTYISDKQMRSAFEHTKPVELAVAAMVRTFKSGMRANLLGNAVKVSDRQFPRIHRLTQRCADTLHIATPQVYIVSNPQLNAMTYGTNEESFVMVHSALVDHYSDEELMTVIGHECGHIHNNHVVYLTTLHWLSQMASLFVQYFAYPAVLALNAWARRAEITCDRAGMLCAKNAEVSQRALTKLALGSKKLYEEFNLDAFLEQYDEGKETMGKYMEAFQTHPYLPKRVLAMRVFAQSELYKTAVPSGDGAPGLKMNEVDDRVRALLKGDA
jgi:Zn-dependent protease with chaperone function